MIYVSSMFQMDIFCGLKKSVRKLCVIGWIVVVSEVTTSRWDIFVPSDFSLRCFDVVLKLLHLQMCATPCFESCEGSGYICLHSGVIFAAIRQKMCSDKSALRGVYLKVVCYESISEERIQSCELNVW